MGNFAQNQPAMTPFPPHYTIYIEEESNCGQKLQKKVVVITFSFKGGEALHSPCFDYL